jgi:hypothetical protein
LKNKLTPLALLIPAVVLAQPAPVPSSQDVMPPPSTIPAPPVNPANPVNPAKAAAALSTAKQLSNQLKGGSLSSGKQDCGSGYTTLSVGGSGSHECIKT